VTLNASRAAPEWEMTWTTRMVGSARGRAPVSTTGRCTDGRCRLPRVWRTGRTGVLVVVAEYRRTIRVRQAPVYQATLVPDAEGIASGAHLDTPSRASHCGRRWGVTQP
jgi:hypothetical protein